MSDMSHNNESRSDGRSSAMDPHPASHPAVGGGFPLDPFRIADRLFAHLWWILTLGILVAIAVAVVLPKKDNFSVVLRFVLRDAFLGVSTERPTSPGRGPALSPSVMASIAAAWGHPEVVSAVATKLNQPQSASDLARGIEVVEDKDPTVSPEVIRVKITSEVDRDHCVLFANAYGEELSEFVKGIQGREFRDLATYYRSALASTDAEMVEVDKELKAFLQTVSLFDYDRETDAFLTHRGQLDRDYQTARIEAESVDLKIQSLVTQVIELKQGELENLLVRYSEFHPLVEERKALLGVLKNQLAKLQTAAVADIDAGSPAVNGLIMQIVNLRVSKVVLLKQAEELNLVRDRVNQKLVGISSRSMDYGKIKSRIQSLQTSRALLMGRLREAELAEKNAIGYVRWLAPTAIPQVSFRSRWLTPLIFGLIAGSVVLLVLGGLILFREVLDDRVVTQTDLSRASGLPVIASLSNLDRLKPADKEGLGIRIWALLSRSLPGPDDQARICGFLSSSEGEGCSTWIRLMAVAARQKGIPVLVISLRSEKAASFAGSTNEPQQAQRWLENALAVGPGLGLDAQVHSPPGNWEWTSERLVAWSSAIKRLQEAGRMTVLVELPAMDSKDALLVSAVLPNTFWLAASGVSRQSPMRAQLELLQLSGARLRGALLNQEPKSISRGFLARWVVSACMVAFTIGSPWRAEAQAEVPTVATIPIVATSKPTGGTNQFLSMVATSQRAPWQEKLTLGPGDVIGVSLYGESALSRGDVVVGPDGRLSYLQATDILASGLTIEELRSAIQQKLSPFYRTPRVLITPIAFRSKKFFLLGAVNQKGVFNLDRPMTLVEAVAQAKGLSSGVLADNQIIELVDFSRSFLIREGSELEVDFEKLFGEGDLSQNVAMAPEDFLYFAPSAREEVYVLGAVASPGITPYTPQLTLAGAVASRGGYGGGAYLSKVLVVRGSLRRPETYVVNLQEILRGKSPDFRLQRKDIIYISTTPWAIVTQVLGMAIQSYTYGVAVSWTGENITRRLLDTKPYIKGL